MARYPLRLSESLYQKIKEKASQENLSIQQFLNFLISYGLGAIEDRKDGEIGALYRRFHRKEADAFLSSPGWDMERFIEHLIKCQCPCCSSFLKKIEEELKQKFFKKEQE